MMLYVCMYVRAIVTDVF